MLRLSECDKVLILSKLEEGWSIRNVARIFNINKSTVLSVKKKWEEDGSVKRKEGSGRPRISNQQQDEFLLDYLRENPFKTAKDAVFHTNFPGSWSTACRRISTSELKNFASAKKQLLSVENKQSRVLFSLNYIHREQNFWESVVFSDEKIFQSSHDGHVKVYRPRNTRYDERYVAPPNRSGRFSVNVWAWMCAQGAGVAWQIEGRLNSQSYLDILENVMLPSVSQTYPNNTFTFQQDNNPVHTARVITQWITNRNVEILPWPSRSPDLNPIENVWGVMVKRMYERNLRFRNKNELWAAIENAWEELSEDQDIWRNLILSMPTRLAQVLESNGAMIKY